MWQRVWSSESNKALQKGAIYGALMTTVVIFSFGFMGFLAAWAGLVKDPSTSFFDILKAGNETAPAWIVVLVSVIAVTLCESAVDSFQNAITSTVVSLGMSFGVKMSLRGARLYSIFLNIPIIIIGLQGLKITSLYLIMNILTTTATVPIILGLLPKFQFYVNGSSVLFGGAFSLASVIVYATLETGSFTQGVYKYFYETYAWQPFVIAVIAATAGVLVFSMSEVFFFGCLGTPYVSDLSMPRKIPSVDDHGYLKLETLTKPPAVVTSQD
jgi:hypothetical protein